MSPLEGERVGPCRGSVRGQGAVQLDPEQSELRFWIRVFPEELLIQFSEGLDPAPAFFKVNISTFGSQGSIQSQPLGARGPFSSVLYY